MADDRYEAYCKMHNMDLIDKFIADMKDVVDTPELLYTVIKYSQKHSEESMQELLKLIREDYGRL